MRVNIYSQELTGEVCLIEKESNTGLTYSAVQMILHSSPMLHHPDQVAATVMCPVCTGGMHHCGDDEGCHGTGLKRIMHDDDRSAVTIWLPKSEERREELAQSLEEMAAMVRKAPPETGLD